MKTLNIILTLVNVAATATTICVLLLFGVEKNTVNETDSYNAKKSEIMQERERIEKEQKEIEAEIAAREKKWREMERARYERDKARAKIHYPPPPRENYNF